MGCKQSTTRNPTPSTPAVAPQQAAPTAVVKTVEAVKPVESSSPAQAASTIPPPQSEEKVATPIAIITKADSVVESTPSVDDLLNQILVEPTPAAPTVIEVTQSPRAESKPASFGERTSVNTSAAASLKEEDIAAPVAQEVSYSEFLAQQENASAAAPKGGKATQKGRKVLFDAETMRKSAPKSTPHAAAQKTKLTKKQQDIVKKNHVSVGRRGPVASRFEKGSRSQMQTDVYLQMANAFERLLTNAETINAHLDTR